MDQDPAGNVRVARADFADYRQSSVVLRVCGEKHFVVGITLLKEALDILFEAWFQPVNGFEYGDGRKFRVLRGELFLCRRLALKPHSAEHGESEENRRRNGSGESKRNE
jgi:hypothetical protein